MHRHRLLGLVFTLLAMLVALPAAANPPPSLLTAPP